MQRNKTIRRAAFICLALLLAFAVSAANGCSFLQGFPGAPSQPGQSTEPGPTTLPPLPSGTSPLPTSDLGGKSPSNEVNLVTGLPSLAPVIDKASPSVVSIQTEAVRTNIFLQPVPEQGAATGVIIDSKGIILTNNHVVEGATKITVTLADRRSFTATDVRRDPQTDLAVLKIDASNLTPARIGNADNLRVGDWVVAIGNALALEGGPTVTVGIISYKGRSIQTDSGTTLYDLIQTDAAINPGNSGGPLLNLAGDVVGINTAIAGQAQNIGFSINITAAMPIIQSLISTGRVVRPYLGVGLYTITPGVASFYNVTVTEGVLVTFVEKNSPAEKAGIKIGDVITSFEGKKVTTDEQLRRAVQARKAGDSVNVTLIRGSSEQTAIVQLGESPPPA